MVHVAKILLLLIAFVFLLSAGTKSENKDQQQVATLRGTLGLIAMLVGAYL